MLQVPSIREHPVNNLKTQIRPLYIVSDRNILLTIRKEEAWTFNLNSIIIKRRIYKIVQYLN